MCVSVLMSVPVWRIANKRAQRALLQSNNCQELVFVRTQKDHRIFYKVTKKEKVSGVLAAFTGCSRSDELDTEQAEDQSHQPANEYFAKPGPNDHRYSNQ